MPSSRRWRRARPERRSDVDAFTLADLVGAVGALIVCAAYFMVSRGMVRAEGAAYHLANLCGALMLLVSLWFRPNPGAIMIEAIWAVIALAALLRIFHRKAK
jgi:hypothetical protein